MGFPTSPFWEDGTKLALLQELASEKRYTAQELSKLLGCTRSMIIGKAFREEIPLMAHRDASIQMQPQRIATMAANRAARQIASEPEPTLPSLNIAPEAIRDGMCRWPYGNGPFTFCGHPVALHKVYCANHAAVAFQKPMARVR